MPIGGWVDGFSDWPAVMEKEFPSPFPAHLTFGEPQHLRENLTPSHILEDAALGVGPVFTEIYITAPCSGSISSALCKARLHLSPTSLLFPFYIPFLY